MLTIDPIDSKYSASIQEIISDPELAQTSDIPASPQPNEALGWIGRMKSLEEQGTGFVFAILVDNRAVGACGLYRVDNTLRTAELGFFIGTPYWGCGYATAGSRLLLARGFTVMGLQSVHSNCLVRNVGAMRVLKKLGFQPLHKGSPPSWSKFPATERYQYWSLTSLFSHQVS